MTEQQILGLDGAREAGCDPDALRRAFTLLDDWVATGVVPGAAALVARHGRIAGEAYVGVAGGNQRHPVSSETVWSLASVTKPFTATAVLLLVERGHLALDESLALLLPEFLDAPVTPYARESVTLRHVLAHCSGLPGISVDNFALRKAHRPLEDFVRSFARQPLLFAPETLHYYSNCGILMAAEVVARAVSGGLGRPLETPAISRFHPFVEESILKPLAMTSTTFFPPKHWGDRIAWVRGTGQEGNDWETANSDYYRSLGIPWGGMFSTARDLVRFVDLFQPAPAGRQRIGRGANSGTSVISPAVARIMTTVQFAPPDAPPSLRPDLRDAPVTMARPSVPWGLGWELKGTKRLERGGDLCSPDAYGHVGATGTMVWGDPATDLTVVLLTNRALASGWTIERPRQALFSNAVCASVL